MSEETDRTLGREYLELARKARLEFCVFRHDAGAPTDVAPLARLLWIQVPEMAARLGQPIAADEGYPPEIKATAVGLANFAARDAVESRPIAQWLDHHIKADTKSLFAKGSANGLNDLIDAVVSREGGVRSDAIDREAREEKAASPALRAFLQSDRSRSDS